MQIQIFIVALFLMLTRLATLALVVFEVAVATVATVQ